MEHFHDMREEDWKREIYKQCDKEDAERLNPIEPGIMVCKPHIMRGQQVDIEKLRLGLTLLLERICVGIPDKDNQSFRASKDVTSDFIKCLISWCGDRGRIINGNGERWEVTVRKIS